MDKNQNFTFLTYTPQTIPPAQLWIGNHRNALHNVEQFLQTMFCKNSCCGICITCMQIRDKQHHALMWLHPEKNYTLEQLDDLFATLAFQLRADELFFFIIQKADFLTPACANKLLKPMEEPPRGYHFILLAECAEQILPTIRSRCIEYTFNNTAQQFTLNPLYECFTKKLVDPHEFSKIIDATAINERESVEVLNAILYFWLTHYTKNSHLPENNSPTIHSLIHIIKHALARPPMPGSSTIFWRNLYLQLYTNLNTTLGQQGFI